MSLIGIIFLTIAVIGVTVVLFVGWVLFSISRALIHGFFPGRPRRIVDAMKARFEMPPLRCLRENCRNFNPPAARFCRCCGSNLMAAKAAAHRPGMIRGRMTA